MIVSKEDFVLWRDHPITQKFMADVQELRERIKEDVATGMYPQEKDYHNVVGRMQVLLEILQGTYVNYLEEEKEETDGA